MDHLIPEPSEITVEDGCRFDLAMPSFEGSGDITHIKIVDAEGNETEDLIEHLKVNATEMAVWQLFLLENYLTVLPTVWHGGYNRCEYIFKESDVDGIMPLKYHDLTVLIKQGKLLPFVEVSKEDEDSYVAFVDCTYWNNWKGLARERVTYKIKAGSVKRRNSFPVPLRNVVLIRKQQRCWEKVTNTSCGKRLFSINFAKSKDKRAVNLLSIHYKNYVRSNYRRYYWFPI